MVNDFVTFSGAATLGGTITANVLNQEYQVTEIVNGSTYKVSARTVSTIESITVSGGISATAVNANSSDTGNGGSSVVGAYQIGSGLNSSVQGGVGWGAGLWGGTTDSALVGQLNEALDASETTITLDSTTGIVANDVILVDSELIKVGGISSNDLTGCTRGHLGTTAATHADNSVVLLAVGNAASPNDFVGWGEAINTDSISAASTLRIWTQDNFGEDLLFNIRGGGIFYWDESSGTGARAINATALGSASNVPTVALQVLVSDIDQHVIAFGTNPIGSSNIDPLFIRFSDQESVVDWRPSTTNTAGDLRLGSGSKIVTAVNQTADSSLHRCISPRDAVHWPTVYLWHQHDIREYNYPKSNLCSCC